MGLSPSTSVHTCRYMQMWCAFIHTCMRPRTVGTVRETCVSVFTQLWNDAKMHGRDCLIAPHYFPSNTLIHPYILQSTHTHSLTHSPQMDSAEPSVFAIWVIMYLWGLSLPQRLHYSYETHLKWQTKSVENLPWIFTHAHTHTSGFVCMFTGVCETNKLFHFKACFV